MIRANPDGPAWLPIRVLNVANQTYRMIANEKHLSEISSEYLAVKLTGSHYSVSVNTHEDRHVGVVLYNISRANLSRFGVD